MRKFAILLSFLIIPLFGTQVSAQSCTMPYTLTNGTTADASQVMANLNALQTCINASAPNPTGIQSINGGPLAGFRNRIVDGNFELNQRGYTSGTALASGVYGFDRWKASSSGATLTFSSTSPDITVTIGSGGSIIQIIEGANIEGGTFTLSWTGTATASVNGGASAASPITVTSLPAGTNVTLQFYSGTLGRVQFEGGSTATTFERRPIGIELSLAQRYYETVSSVSGAGYASGSGQGWPVYVRFAVPKRTTPTITSGFATGNCSVSIVDVGTDQFAAYAVSSAAGAFSYYSNVAVSASAEL